MSGGVAYVLDESGHFGKLHNAEMTEAVALTDVDDIKFLKSLIYRHLESTDSPKARLILDKWSDYEPLFRRVQPMTPPPPPAPVAPAAAAEPAKA